MKKIINVLVVLIISIPMFAQTEYYYFKGQRIPLTVNPKKKCLVSKSLGEQPIQPILPSSLPEELEMEAVITRDAFTRYIIKEVSNQTGFLHQFITDSINQDQYKIDDVFITRDSIEIVPSDFIYIKLKNEADTSRLQNYANRYNLKIDHQNIYMPLWYVIEVQQETRLTTLEMSNILYETGEFSAVEPDLTTIKTLNNISWDEDVDQQWGLYNSLNSNIDINASSAWNYATGKGVKVGIFDSGVEYTHEDLAENMDSLNYDTESNTSDRIIYSNHGTFVAGIVAAERNNGKFLAGVAPNAKIVPISKNFELCPLSTEKIANGFNWAARNGVDIINCSWHWVESQLLTDAIDYAIDYGRDEKGIIIIFAAGNTGRSVNFPANYRPEILAVGSIDCYGIKAPSSSYDSTLDVVAPGVDVFSTALNNSIRSGSGTSYAAPHVSGIAALVLELNPDLIGQQVRDIIERSTIKVGDGEYTIAAEHPNGLWNECYGYGLVNALKAVQLTPRKRIEY